MSDEPKDIQKLVKMQLSEFEVDETLRWYNWSRLSNLGKKESVGILSTRIGPFQHLLEHELEGIFSEKEVNEGRLSLWKLCYGSLIHAKNKLNEYDVDCAGAYYHMALRVYWAFDLSSAADGKERQNVEKENAPKKGAKKDMAGQDGAGAKQKDVKEPGEPPSVKVQEQLFLEDQNEVERWSISLEGERKPKADKDKDPSEELQEKARQAYINKLAESTLIDGQKHLCLEDQKKLEKWLFKDGKVDPDLPLENLIQSQRLIHQHEEEDHFKTNLIQAQLILLSFVSLVIALGAIMLLAIVDINAPFDNLASLLVVAFFGALGGSVSGMYSFKTMDWAKNDERYVQLLNKYLTLSKPLVGASVAIAAIIFLSAGVVTIDTESTGIYPFLVIAFASGFTERIITTAVGKLGNEKAE